MYGPSSTTSRIRTAPSSPSLRPVSASTCSQCAFKSETNQLRARLGPQLHSGLIPPPTLRVQIALFKWSPSCRVEQALQLVRHERTRRPTPVGSLVCTSNARERVDEQSVRLDGPTRHRLHRADVHVLRPRAALEVRACEQPLLDCLAFHVAQSAEVALVDHRCQEAPRKEILLARQNLPVVIGRWPAGSYGSPEPLQDLRASVRSRFQWDSRGTNSSLSRAAAPRSVEVLPSRLLALHTVRNVPRD
jgi:hypothetical protein